MCEYLPFIKYSKKKTMYNQNIFVKFFPVLPLSLPSYHELPKKNSNNNKYLSKKKTPFFTKY